MYQNDCNSECILLYQIKTSLKIHIFPKKKQTKKTTTKTPKAKKQKKYMKAGCDIILKCTTVLIKINAKLCV